jgi:FkbM family methyltransferase
VADFGAMTMRRRVITTLDQLGVGDHGRRARRAMQPSYLRQNFRDDESLRLFLRLALPADANCVDVGANIGDILTGILAAAPNGKHVGFEPVPWLADDLARRFPDVAVRREAASDSAGTASFTVLRESPSRSGLTATSEEVGELVSVETVRLDDALTAPPAFIKIDVEGAELEVLRGARETLRSHRPIVAIEHGHHGAPDAERNLAVYDEFAAADLRLCDMDGRNLDRDSFHAVYLSRERWNFLARP